MHQHQNSAAGLIDWKQLATRLRRKRSTKAEVVHQEASGGLQALEPRLLLTAVAIEGVERISELPGGLDPNGASFHSSISRDGQFVVFSSRASNLVANDTNGVEDVFLLDRFSGRYELISVNSNEMQGNFASLEPVITPDGRYVAFRSFATNLDGSNTPEGNIFVRDRVAGTTSRVSFTPAGSGAFQPSISHDGQVITYLTEINGAVQVAVHDRSAVFPAPDTVVITNSLTLGVGNRDSGGAVVSGSGQYIVFHSLASNLIDTNLDGQPDDFNGVSDIFRYDRATGLLEMLITGNGNSFNPDVTFDGQNVVFETDATNLFPMDRNGRRDVVLFSVGGTGGGGTFQLISRIDPPTGQPIQGNADSFTAKISDSGRFIVFASSASNWFPFFDDDFDVDIFVTDEAKDTISLVTYNGFLGETGNDHSTLPAISSDGSIVTFQSSATNLDVDDTNGLIDIYGALTDFIPPLTVDITGQIISTKVPATMVTGEPPRNAGLQVLITNQGLSSAVTGQLIDVEVYLRPIGGGPDILVGETENLSISGLDPGRSRSLTVRLDIPETLPSGSYEIYTVIDANQEVIGEVEFGNSTFFSPQQLLVANPFIDLEPQFSFDQPSLLVPGDRVRQQLIINNAGNVTADGTVLVRLLASEDPFADPGDVVLTDQTVRLRAKPGKATKVNFNLRNFPALPPGNFFLVADVQPLTGDPVLLEDVSAAAISDDTVQVLSQFGSVGERERVRLMLPDINGDLVQFSFSGAGTGTVTPNGAGFDINLTGTNQKTRVNIKSRGEPVILNNVTSDNSLGTFGSPRNLTLDGTFTVNGSVDRLLFDDLTGANINVSGALGDFRADVVTDTNLTVGTILGRAQVATWEGGSLTAGSAGQIRATGSRDTDDANLHLDVSLTDALFVESLGNVLAKDDISGNWAAAAGVGMIRGGSLTGFNTNFAGSVDRIFAQGDASGSMTMLSLNDMRVLGDLTGANIVLTQGVSPLQAAIDRLQVNGLIVDSTIRAAGNINRVTAGAMVDSNLFAGVSAAETNLPDSAADFVSPAIISDLLLRGVSGRDFEFEGSNVAASRLGDVRLGDVNPNNGGVPFGLAMQNFDTLDYVLNGNRVRADNGDVSPLQTAGDFVIRIL